MTKQQILFKVVSILKEHGFDVLPEQENMETNFYSDLGLDSIDAIDVVMDVERYFRFNMKDELFEGIKTLGDMVNIISDYMPREIFK
jgi:acyl carrier protein